MIPDTLLGLLLFVGAIGPGFVWVLVAEQRKPREDRSTILEAAELSFVGILTTSIAALTVLGIAKEWKALDIDTTALAERGGEYLLEEPVRGFGTLLAILLLSFGLAYAAARLKHPQEPSLRPGFNVWDEVFRLVDQETQVFVTVELRDRRRFSGWVHTWDVGAGESREVSLHAPLSVKAPGEQTKKLDVHFVALQQESIVWLSALWFPPPPGLESPRSGA